MPKVKDLQDAVTSALVELYDVNKRQSEALDKLNLALSKLTSWISVQESLREEDKCQK